MKENKKKLIDIIGSLMFQMHKIININFVLKKKNFFNMPIDIWLSLKMCIDQWSSLLDYLWLNDKLILKIV